MTNRIAAKQRRVTMCGIPDGTAASHHPDKIDAAPTLMSLRRLAGPSTRRSTWFRRNSKDNDNNSNDDFVKRCLATTKPVEDTCTTATSCSTQSSEMQHGGVSKTRITKEEQEIQNKAFCEEGAEDDLVDDEISSEFLTTHHTWYYSSIHVLVNRERVKQELKPLFRSPQLDELARQQAQRLANQGQLEASPRTFLVKKLQATVVGENVVRGPTIRDMHLQCMQQMPRHTKRILSSKYNEMGAGTAKNDDNNNEELYMVQYFRYNPNLPSDDEMMMNQSNTAAAATCGGVLGTSSDTAAVRGIIDQALWSNKISSKT